MPASLTLFVPALLRPFAQRQSAAIPAMPCLERLLARADRRDLPAADRYAALARIFNADAPDRPPVAALSWSADNRAPADGDYHLRADPVHLHPDRDRLLLFDAGQLDIQAPESEQLAQSLSGYFSDLGLQLTAPTPQRWYLRLPGPVALHTHPPDQVSGRDLLHYLPGGPDGPRWRALLNEVQMLLHDHPVNQRREERGAPPVNSLWFWGNGDPMGAVDAAFEAVYSADPVAAGLANLATIAVRPVPSHADQWLAQNPPEASTGTSDNHLLQLEPLERAQTRADPDAWSEALQSLERDWLAPLLGALQARRIERVTLVEDQGRGYRLTRSGLRRWWRRTPAYQQHQYLPELSSPSPTKPTPPTAP